MGPLDTGGAPEGATGGADRAADLRSALWSRRRVPAPSATLHTPQASCQEVPNLLVVFLA